MMNDLFKDTKVFKKPQAKETIGFRSLLDEKQQLSAAEKASFLLPYALFLVLLSLVYIGNSHQSEWMIRAIEREKLSVRELGWEYKILSTDLMFMRRRTEIAKKARALGLQESVSPPIQISINSR